MQTSPRSAVPPGSVPPDAMLAVRVVRPPAEGRRPTPESAWRDPAYGCVDWYGYQAADEKPAKNDGGA
jgi:hypothetical protein